MELSTREAVCESSKFSATAQADGNVARERSVVGILFRRRSATSTWDVHIMSSRAKKCGNDDVFDYAALPERNNEDEEEERLTVRMRMESCACCSGGKR